MAKTVSVGGLGHGGASRAIRDAQRGPVLVSKETRPAAWIVGAEALARVAQAHGDGTDIYQQAMELLAVELYQEEVLTLGQGAKLAGMPLGDFIDLCGKLHVPILWPPAEDIGADVDAFTSAISGD